MERCALLVAMAAVSGVTLTLLVVSYVWRIAHRYSYERIQNQQEMNAESCREYELLLKQNNMLMAERNKARKERDEAELWNHQLAKDLKAKYMGDKKPH